MTDPDTFLLRAKDNTALNSSFRRKPIIMIIGPKPPPYHGVSVSTEKLLISDVRRKFDIYHVDTADHRGIQHINKPDLHDILLFLKQFYQSLKIIICKRPSAMYLPISQKTLGFLRDSLFILLCIVGRCRIIIHLHGGNFRNWYEQRSRVFRKFIRSILRSIDVMIVLSESFKKLFDGLIPSYKIVVVPNGVKGVQLEKSDIDVSKTLGQSSMVVLYLGTLKRQKGVLVLIRSIPYVLYKRPDIRFVMAGPWADYSDKEEVEEFIRVHELSHVVDFVGPVEGLIKWQILKRSDIFVFPGIQQEGQPLVVLEAMAAGLPIVYTNQGCLQETCIDSFNGLQVKTNDSIDLANKILLLANNPVLLNDMGQRNRQLYQNKFTAKHYVNNMLNVFYQNI